MGRSSAAVAAAVTRYTCPAPGTAPRTHSALSGGAANLVQQCALMQRAQVNDFVGFANRTWPTVLSCGSTRHDMPPFPRRYSRDLWMTASRVNPWFPPFPKGG